MRHHTMLGLLALLAALQVGCRSPVAAAGGDPPPASVPVEGVKLTPQTLQLARIGDSLQLVALVMPDSATDKTVTWVSADSTVVSVSASGVITARGAGVGVFVTVTTHDGHHEATVNVRVAP